MLAATLAFVIGFASRGPVMVVGPQQLEGAREAQAAVDNAGNVYVVYGSGEDIFCSKSSDKGKRFDAPVKVASAPNLALGMRRGPRVAVSGERVVVTAITDGNLVAWTSSNAGREFSSTPLRINDAPESALEGLHSEASQGDKVVCVWLDHRNGGQNVYVSVSKDAGASWGPNLLAYQSPEGSVCECCQPSVAFSPDGAIHVMFRNSLKGNRDMYVANSKDDGKSWSNASMLGEGNWKLDACPMDGGAIDFDAAGKMFTVWRRGEALYRTEPGTPELMLGAGQQPWLHVAEREIYGVYLKGRRGPLMVFRSNGEPKTLSEDASNPMVVGSDSANGAVIAVWATSRGEIMCEVLND